MNDELLIDMVRELNRLKRRMDDMARPEIAKPPVWLDSPLTSASWDGDARSTTAKTVIDLSAVFGVPAGVRAVLVGGAIRDSGSAANLCFLLLAPNNVAGQGLGVQATPVNDRYTYYGHVVPCDANGDIYHQIQASAAGAMDVWLEIWAYWP